MPRPHSTSIGHKAAQTLYYARQQAEYIGLGLNMLVTINFGLTSIRPEEATAAFGRLRTNHFNKWCRRPRKGRGTPCEPTYCYYFENARDGVAFEKISEGVPHNVHVHWEAHVPPKRQHEFRLLVREWLDFISGEMSAENAVDIKPIFDGRGLRAYSLKGAQKSVADHFGAGSRQEDQGLIIGRRTGTSANIGAAARRATDQKRGIRRRRAA